MLICTEEESVLRELDKESSIQALQALNKWCRGEPSLAEITGMIMFITHHHQQPLPVE
jgi:hypothetical protein